MGAYFEREGILGTTCTIPPRRLSIVRHASLLISAASILSCSVSRAENPPAGAEQGIVRAASARSECYRFDRPYFHWLEPYVGDRALLPDSVRVFDIGDGVPLISGATYVLMLTDTGSAERGGGDRAGTLEPIPYRQHASVRSNWLRNSRWRVGEGVAHIRWFSGFFGPEFRMQVVGDTLRGTVRFRTDVLGSEPQLEPAWALRVPCPVDLPQARS